MGPRRQPRAVQLNLDVLAMSLLCCLLASVVALIVARSRSPAVTKTPEIGIETASAPLPAPGPALDWRRLGTAASSMGATGQSMADRAETMATRVSRSIAERENSALSSQVADLSKKLALMQAIKAADDEARRLEKLLDHRSQTAASAAQGVRRLVGDYRGPFVLIECTEGAVTVYPGNERLDIKTAKAQLDSLVARIVAAGFVAFVVRPGGWYADSFDEMRPRIYEALAKVKKETGRHIGRSTLPLDASEAIADYLPTGGRT